MHLVTSQFSLGKGYWVLCMETLETSGHMSKICRVHCV